VGVSISFCVVTRRRPGADAGGATAKNYGGETKPETMVPATIKALKAAVEAASASATEDQFKLNGVPVHNLTIVGKVVSAEQKDNGTVAYKVDDSTGVCDVKVWADDSVSTPMVSMGTYVRVYGSIKKIKDEYGIAAYSAQAVRPVTDFNEVTFHMLEVIYASGHAQKLKGAAPVTGAAPTSVYSVPVTNIAAEGDMNSNNPDIAVRAVLSKAQLEEGLTLVEVCDALSGKFTADAIRSVLDDMTNTGEVYNTVDDDHFALIQ